MPSFVCIKSERVRGAIARDINQKCTSRPGANQGGGLKCQSWQSWVNLVALNDCDYVDAVKRIRASLNLFRDLTAYLRRDRAQEMQ